MYSAAHGPRRGLARTAPYACCSLYHYYMYTGTRTRRDVAIDARVVASASNHAPGRLLADCAKRLLAMPSP